MIKNNFRVVLLSLSILFTFSTQQSFAGPYPDEGMWLANLVRQLNISKMQAMGMQLSADDIYNTNSASLKDAVVQLGQGDGGFCTAELVSSNGLLFTNHHCGFEALASVSTTEHNYIDDGYWALTYNEEIPIPGLWIRILMNTYDITDSILPQIQGLSASESKSKIAEIQNRISDRFTNEGYVVDIKPMYYGNQYYAFLYKQFNDVRFTGAPPSSIGNYGGDTDNWMWPRHTGDFSVFRVYADKNNDPAEYSADNVPYKPKRYLQISLDGYKEGDFAMIMGYPGSTKRYLTSYGIEDVMNETNPAFVTCIQTATDVMKEEMDKNDSVRIQLAADYAQLMNGLKLFKTQIDGMKRMDAVSIKEAEEKEFNKWAMKQGKDEKKKYDAMFNSFDSAYQVMASVTDELYYKRYAVFFMSSGSFALDLQSVESLFGDEDPAPEVTEATIAGIQESADEMWKSFHYETEMKKMEAFLNMLYTKLPADKQPAAIKEILSNSKGNTPQEKFKSWTEKAFAKSVFTSKEKLNAFLADPNEKKLKKDVLYNYYIDVYNESAAPLAIYRGGSQRVAVLQKEYVAAIMEKEKGNAFYPDANSTFRLTYGTVQDYEARDAVHYNWQTTLTGVIEKMDSTNAEFVVPKKLYELYLAKDYGRYADANGNMPVCFISNLDITGGNSGSPVLNGKGELIGLAFDGNYEGTPGDYIFDPAMNRTISVDIRYVLFVIDKFAGAQNLIKELTIAK